MTAAGCGHGSPPLRHDGGLGGGGPGRQARPSWPGVQIHGPGRGRGDNIDSHISVHSNHLFLIVNTE